MRNTLLLAVVCFAGGFAVARLMPFAITPAEETARAAGTQDFAAARSADSVESRLRELEQAVAAERQARQLLQDELMYLTESLEALGGGVLVEAASATGAREAMAGDAAAQRRGRGRSREDRVARLTEAGFAPDRAEMIVRREAEMRMNMLETRFQAQQSGDFEALQDLYFEQTQQFRDELGPDQYERYLAAEGRSTRINIGNVIDTSPAQKAGLRPGDSILSYGGTRVYNMMDLNRATLEGAAGETVIAEVLRDGVVMQVAVPRGPLGITEGSRRR